MRAWSEASAARSGANRSYLALASDPSFFVRVSILRLIPLLNAGTVEVWQKVWDVGGQWVHACDRVVVAVQIYRQRAICGSILCGVTFWLGQSRITDGFRGSRFNVEEAPVWQLIFSCISLLDVAELGMGQLCGVCVEEEGAGSATPCQPHNGKR